MKMLQFLNLRLDSRLRRFAVECCRRVSHMITENVFVVAAMAGEAFADDPRNEQQTIRPMGNAAFRAYQQRRRYAATADPHLVCAADAARATCAPTDGWQRSTPLKRLLAQQIERTLIAVILSNFTTKPLCYAASSAHCLFAPLLLTRPGSPPPSPPWPLPFTRSGRSTGCQSWLMHWRIVGATTRRCCATCGVVVSTVGDVGRWISC